MRVAYKIKIDEKDREDTDTYTVEFYDSADNSDLAYSANHANLFLIEGGYTIGCVMDGNPYFFQVFLSGGK